MFPIYHSLKLPTLPLFMSPQHQEQEQSTNAATDEDTNKAVLRLKTLYDHDKADGGVVDPDVTKKAPDDDDGHRSRSRSTSPSGQDSTSRANSVIPINRNKILNELAL